MKFFRNKEIARVKKIRAVRIRLEIHDPTEKVDIEFQNEAGDRLTLELTPQQAGTLSQELANAYEAINPPLRRSQNFSQWDGMS